MSDYNSQFTGAEIDARLAKVPQLESGLAQKQDTLQSGVNIKTINNEPILGPGDIHIESESGTGIDDVSSAQDGTVVITLSTGDKVTIDLNHVHPQYPKYTLLNSESEMPATPESDRLYLIKESS